MCTYTNNNHWANIENTCTQEWFSKLFLSARDLSKVLTCHEHAETCKILAFIYKLYYCDDLQRACIRYRAVRGVRTHITIYHNYNPRCRSVHYLLNISSLSENYSKAFRDKFMHLRIGWEEGIRIRDFSIKPYQIIVISYEIASNKRYII